MTQDGQRAIDLDIKVTPVIEDAFYFLRLLQEDNELPTDENESFEDFEKRLHLHYDGGQKAGERLAKIPYEERMQAIHYGYQMLDNIKKYGVACAEWEK